ncbi:hypothetical protein WDV86_04810 [Pseudokineococcus sp. 1T1Z-3]
MAFNHMRGYVEKMTENRWRFSGEADLVLVNTFIPLCGEVAVDWVSAQHGTIFPTATLSAVVEKISDDLDNHREDPAYGLASVTRSRTASADRGIARALIVNAVAALVAELGVRVSGI